MLEILTNPSTNVTVVGWFQVVSKYIIAFYNERYSSRDRVEDQQYAIETSWSITQGEHCETNDKRTVL